MTTKVLRDVYDICYVSPIYFKRFNIYTNKTVL